MARPTRVGPARRPQAWAEILAATDAIQTLKARYCRLLDAKDWAAWQGLFTPEAILETGSRAAGLARIEGAEAIAAAIRSLLAEATTVHRAFMPEIEIDSARSARGIWAMEDWLDWATWKGCTRTRRTVTGRGHYYECYVCEAGEWQFQSIRLVRAEVIEQRVTRA